MELWIRSQDKTTLIRSYEIYIAEYGKDSYVIRAKRTSHILGAYNSFERAIEVLDEIQNILNLKDMYKYDRELVLKSWENVDEEQVKIVRQQMSVYKMPKD